MQIRDIIKMTWRVGSISAEDLKPEPEKSPDILRIFFLIIHVVTLREDTLVSSGMSGFLQRFISERATPRIFIYRTADVYIYMQGRNARVGIPGKAIS